jgi:protein involved in polysaccharide export with SLBB domain
MQMVVILTFLFTGAIAWGQGSGNVPGTFGTNSASLQDLKKMVWNSPGGPAQGFTNHLPGQVLSSTLAGYVPDDKYKLRVGDRVSFQILEDRGAPSFLVVADSGELDFPYVGRVPAVDKTCKQLVAEVKALLEKDFYYHATAIMALDTANKIVGRVYVWGQVRNQGPVEMLVNETMTAGKAILRAGGFGDFANKKKVKIIRNAETPGATPQTIELNMVDILENGKTDKDVSLQPDDFIIIPTRLINF